MPTGPLSSLFQKVPTGILTVVNGHLSNLFLMVRAARDPFIAACLEVATINVTERRSNRVYECTGPAVLSAFWTLISPSPGDASDPLARTVNQRDHSGQVAAILALRPEVSDAFNRFTLRHLLSHEGAFTVADAAYKHTDLDWRRWKGSIFVEAAGVSTRG